MKTLKEQQQQAAAEMAVAKYLNVFWNAASEGFVGGYQVRYNADGGLYLSPEDTAKYPPSTKFIVVSGDNPYKICGWITMEEAMKPEFEVEPFA